MSSVTIRVSGRDKERPERLARKKGIKTLSETFRFALSTAEREADTFHGNIDALIKAHESVQSVGNAVSENID